MTAQQETLEDWLERQYRHAARAMLRSVSPVGITKTRAGFGQTIRACKGSIVASPVLADWDPQPDYFFHWFRDSAVVIEALRELCLAGAIGAQAREHFADFVRFSLGLRALDGRQVIAAMNWRANVAPDFVRFLRPDRELAEVYGAAVIAETRVNPDGTLDFSSWTRPQYDGAPLRALAVLRWVRAIGCDPALQGEVAELVRGDLEFTFSHWNKPSYDIWEEESGFHYYTMCVCAAALAAGAEWLERLGNAEVARQYHSVVHEIHDRLDGYWLADAGHYRSRVLADGTRSRKELDIAVILGAIHARGPAQAHTARDPRVHATLMRLEELFDALYDINRNRPSRRRPALGRYAGDVYFSGGAYYFATLGAAELCYLAAQEGSAPEWLARGDGFLETVRHYTPVNGEMSEQFDQRTGTQTSAQQLAWSYAAFISCVTARRAVAGAAVAARSSSRGAL